MEILGILVYDRIKEAGKTQEILSKYADIIITRLGFHELSREKCSRMGTIIITIKGSVSQQNGLKEELAQIGGIEIQTMKFSRG